MQPVFSVLLACPPLGAAGSSLWGCGDWRRGGRDPAARGGAGRPQAGAAQVGPVRLLRL